MNELERPVSVSRFIAECDVSPKYCEARNGTDVCCLRAHHMGDHVSWQADGVEMIRHRWTDGQESEQIEPHVKTNRGVLVIQEV